MGPVWGQHGANATQSRASRGPAQDQQITSMGQDGTSTGPALDHHGTRNGPAHHGNSTGPARDQHRALCVSIHTEAQTRNCVNVYILLRHRFCEFFVTSERETLETGDSLRQE